MAVETQLHAADHALRSTEEDVLGFLVSGRAAVRARAPLAVIPGADAQRVPDYQPARARAPCGFEDERAWEVAPARRDHDPAGREAEGAGGSVQDGGEHTRAVRSRQAHPLHPPAGSDQGVDLAVR